MASVDVVIPCYNYGRFLGECVASVLAQDGVALRILIVDNASEDDSLAVARSLASQDPRIEVRAHEVNLGATRSYNAGIDWARSDYLLILDADDLLTPGALGRAAAILDSDSGISFLYGIEARQEPDGAIHPTLVARGPDLTISQGLDFVRGLCRTPVNSVGANTVVRRTSVQTNVGHYRASLPYTDDLEMWLRLATTGQVAFVRSVQAIRRYHDSRMSTHYQTIPVRDFVERARAFESFFAVEGRTIPDADRLLSEARTGLGEHAFWSAISHFARGHGRLGADLVKLSRNLRPSGAVMPPFGWLVRMDRPIERTRTILSEAVARLLPGFARSTDAGGG